jgi:ribosomal protein S12 methylthiotransferase
MRRGGSGEAHLRLLESLRARVPGIALRTTFIVGFPGESEAQFATLCAFVEEAAFDHVGVFTYSEEKGTPAAGLRDDVPAEVKEERRARIMAIQEEHLERRRRALVGRTVEVLVEGPHPESDLLLAGRTEGQAPEIDGGVILTDAPRVLYPGEFVTMRVASAHAHDLVGPVVAAPSRDAAPPAARPGPGRP